MVGSYNVSVYIFARVGKKVPLYLMTFIVFLHLVKMMVVVSSHQMPRIMGGYDPCLDGYATTYYNRPDVQKALHVSDGQNLKQWSICK